MMKMGFFYKLKKSFPKLFGKSASLTSRQRLDLSASCAIPTADESSHSAAGMLHLHGNATFVLYATLR